MRRDQTHRLIPYRYSDRGRPILDRLAQGDDDLLSDLTELEGATNDRLLGESGRLPGVSALELVSGFPLAHIVNATFTHTRPSGGRFNSSARGAWYASFEMATAQREVAFHQGAELKEVGWKAEEISPYIDYLADFRHEFHDLRGEANFAACLDANSYNVVAGAGDQAFDERLGGNRVSQRATRGWEFVSRAFGRRCVECARRGDGEIHFRRCGNGFGESRTFS